MLLLFCVMQGGESTEDGAADSGSEARSAAASVHDAAGGVDETRPPWRRCRQRRQRCHVLSVRLTRFSANEHSSYMIKLIVTATGRSKYDVSATYLPFWCGTRWQVPYGLHTLTSTLKTHYRIQYWMLVAYEACLQISVVDPSWVQYDTWFSEPVGTTGPVAKGLSRTGTYRTGV